MDFDYNEEQRMFMDAVDGFAERNLAEGALRRAHARGFPKDIAKMMYCQQYEEQLSIEDDHKTVYYALNGLQIAYNDLEE